MSTLTPEQQLAAFAATSIAVTAGAGTGKTHMLAERYLFHVLEQGQSPLDIVALTFTEKAAAELRARIRKTLHTRLTENRFERLAELDASFISTFHALCARICRDHPHAAGVSGDFAILDTLEGPIWQAEKLEEVLRRLPLDLYESLPYSTMRTLMQTLLTDPLAAEAALNQSPTQWPEWIAQARGEARERLLGSPEWQEAQNTLFAFEGDMDDKAEQNRRLAIQAMHLIESGENLGEGLALIDNLNMVGGSKKLWPHGGLDIIKACMKSLRETVREALAELLPTIRDAYGRVRADLRREKQKAHVLDFADLEEYALRVLRNEPGICEAYALHWRVFLVDEFQDTNPVQAELLESLGKSAQLTIVGDEKQSIYGFRRADITCFRSFQSHVERRGGQRLSIAKSFRTHHALVSLTNKVFEPLLQDTYKPLSAHREESPHVAPHMRAYGVEADKSVKKDERQIIEARFIARQLRDMLDSGTHVHDRHTQVLRPVQPGDIAVLARTWGPLELYGDVFREFNLPAVHAGGGSLLETREAKDIWALIRFLAMPQDNLALAALLRSPFFAVSDSVLQHFAQTLPEKALWWERLRQNPAPDSERAISVLTTLLAASRQDHPLRVLQLADRLTGYTAVLGYLPGAIRRKADWDGMLALAGSLSHGPGDMFTVFRRIQKLAKNAIMVPRPFIEPDNAIALMTVHAAKGLEWPVVVLPDLTRKGPTHRGDICMDPEMGLALKFEDDAGNRQKPALYKLIDARQTQREEDEAVRVLYVAFTRARDHLILTATDTHGEALDRLKPGLDAAGIPIQAIIGEFSAEKINPQLPQPQNTPLETRLVHPLG